jgi:hypothetical protein
MTVARKFPASQRAASHQLDGGARHGFQHENGWRVYPNARSVANLI